MKIYLPVMKNPLATVSDSTKSGVFSFLLFGILLFAYLYETRMEEHEAAAKDSRNFAWALSEQARSVFDAANEDLGELQDHLTEDDFTCGKNCRNRSRFKEIHDDLYNSIVRSNVLDAYNIHDEHGDLLYSSVHPLPVVNNLDRPYFQEIKTHPELGLVYSDPLVSRTTHKPSIILVQRVLSKSGKFIGTMQANVGMDQFVNIYKALNLGTKSVISMRTIKGFHRMARYPEVSEEQEPLTKTLDHPLKAYLDKKVKSKICCKFGLAMTAFSAC